ncbi:hypothetical protein K488DRAFT_68507 [Vararia minispora EC-137]|uniref:Uncharacterized protein n=1 Tax=Vararia minispora EC-137 TaxID=1314806 RepID=A0ACB8QVH3_9AGAM|nr:hypothetical protein K488DRAFT_68507 [Vararia minispora EC-137]
MASNARRSTLPYASEYAVPPVHRAPVPTFAPPTTIVPAATAAFTAPPVTHIGQPYAPHVVFASSVPPPPAPAPPPTPRPSYVPLPPSPYPPHPSSASFYNPPPHDASRRAMRAHIEALQAELEAARDANARLLDVHRRELDARRREYEADRRDLEDEMSLLRRDREAYRYVAQRELGSR